MDMTSRDAPWFHRRQVWDNVLKKRRGLFWDELTDEERIAELEYHNMRNKQLLEDMKNGNR